MILSHRCFPVNFAKFLRVPFFLERFWWLFCSIELRVFKTVSTFVCCHHLRFRNTVLVFVTNSPITRKFTHLTATSLF